MHLDLADKAWSLVNSLWYPRGPMWPRIIDLLTELIAKRHYRMKRQNQPNVKSHLVDNEISWISTSGKNMRKMNLNWKYNVFFQMMFKPRAVEDLQRQACSRRRSVHDLFATYLHLKETQEEDKTFALRLWHYLKPLTPGSISSWASTFWHTLSSFFPLVFWARNNDDLEELRTLIPLLKLNLWNSKWIEHLKKVAHLLCQEGTMPGKRLLDVSK